MRRCNNCHRYHEGSHWYCPECQAKIDARRAEERERKIREGYNIKLIDAREAKGYLQKGMARKIGISTVNYSKMEAGKKSVKPSWRRVIAATLDKTVEELWDEPYYAECRRCRSKFATDRDVDVCPDCLERAKTTAMTRAVRAHGNQGAITEIAKRARQEGLTYGKYVALQDERRARR